MRFEYAAAIRTIIIDPLESFKPNLKKIIKLLNIEVKFMKAKITNLLKQEALLSAIF